MTVIDDGVEAPLYVLMGAVDSGVRDEQKLITMARQHIEVLLEMIYLNIDTPDGLDSSFEELTLPFVGDRACALEEAYFQYISMLDVEVSFNAEALSSLAFEFHRNLLETNVPVKCTVEGKFSFYWDKLKLIEKLGWKNETCELFSVRDSMDYNLASLKYPPIVEMQLFIDKFEEELSGAGISNKARPLSPYFFKGLKAK